RCLHADRHFIREPVRRPNDAETPPMIYLNVLLSANEGADLAAIAEALRRAGELSQKEPGCQRWEAYQSDADPKRFLLVERGESEAALDGHRRGEAYTQIYSKELLPHVTREPLRGKRII